MKSNQKNKTNTKPQDFKAIIEQKEKLLWWQIENLSQEISMFCHPLEKLNLFRTFPQETVFVKDFDEVFRSIPNESAVNTTWYGIFNTKFYSTDDRDQKNAIDDNGAIDLISKIYQVDKEGWEREKKRSKKSPKRRYAINLESITPTVESLDGIIYEVEMRFQSPYSSMWGSHLPAGASIRLSNLLEKRENIFLQQTEDKEKKNIIGKYVSYKNIDQITSSYACKDFIALDQYGTLFFTFWSKEDHEAFYSCLNQNEAIVEIDEIYGGEYSIIVNLKTSQNRTLLFYVGDDHDQAYHWQDNERKELNEKLGLVEIIFD